MIPLQFLGGGRMAEALLTGLLQQGVYDAAEIGVVEVNPSRRAELEGIDHRTEQVVLPKSDLRKALNYLGNHWTELTRYLSDATLSMDNNECEQLMKQVGLGRNYAEFRVMRSCFVRRSSQGLCPRTSCWANCA